MKKSLHRHSSSVAAVGLKRTAPRLAVLDVFHAMDHPLSVQEITEKIPAGIADQATVYRTIKAFLEQGMIREVNLRHDHLDYELTDLEDHHHIVCTNCGYVENFTGCEGEKLTKQVLKKSSSFKEIREHAIELFGLCVKCT